MAAQLSRARITGLLLVAAILLLAGLFVSYQFETERRALHGYLYFGGGTFLGQFDLGDGTSSVVQNLGDVNIRHVSDNGGRQLLLTVSGPVNNKLVSRLMRYQLDTGQQRTLFAGRKAKYVPGASHIVFQDGKRLTSTAPQINDYRETTIEQRDDGDTPVIVLSMDRILYSRPAGDAEQIMLRNVETAEEWPLESLSAVCQLQGAVWISDQAELLCPSTTHAGYLLASFDAAKLRPVDLGGAESGTALTYLPGQHAVVFAVRSRGFFGGATRNDVWVYDLQNDSTFRIAKDQFLGDSVAYKRY